ncbi:MAG: ATP-binding protein [Jaaginema sp. PMC 1079.18]|nr:ATP-binding protein [Jaaginema sp. PMC 1080.18]MEC4851189.1 ATP-binding protein [Jaaginema sp. PMC 1079.18]MEC4865005.1 ATP-binding protein [Jaaginema sp. PMC 1078.18]
MALRLALVVLIISGISYWHLMSQLAWDTQASLLSYISERGQREAAVFVLAEDDHTLLRNAFLKEFSALQTSERVSLERHFFRWSDNSIRNVPEGTQPQDFDTERYPTTFLQPGVELTSDIQQRLDLSYQLVAQYGAGWRDRFIDTYVTLPEGSMTMFWPGAAWGINAQPDLDIPAQEWAYLGDLEHNPHRKTTWTGVYADPVTQDWMVSAETPIDDTNGRHLATIGHDMILTDLLDRTIADRIEGTYNLLLRPDGQLIAEPHLMAEIRAKEGKLNVKTAGDAHLERIFELVRQSNEPSRVVYNRRDREYLAIAKLNGPDWYLITVYPEKLLQAQAFDNTWFLLCLALASLGLEIILLFIVLRRQITAPIQDLLKATQQVTQGDFAVDLDTQRQDELGQLAASFTQMTQQLQSAFNNLEQKIAEQKLAENIILEKTEALEQALQELQQMQLQTVQNEKMSALGNLMAGVAHEINNPIGFLKGNVQPAQEYVRDLLNLIDFLLQKAPSNDPEIATELAEIELEFIREDLLQLLQSMSLGIERLRNISISLRIFSRQDQDHKTAFQIHNGIDSTLLILKHRTKGNEHRGEIQIVKQYGDIPEIYGFPGQLNQVLMNLLANAVDALDEVPLDAPYITINTQVLDSEQVVIRIQDNGCGMTTETQNRIFEQGFTTKAVGKGTGLGLAIAYRIVTETHHGQLTVESTPGQGSTFIIQLPIEG